MQQTQPEVYRRARDHYARELLGGRGFIRATWIANTILATALVGSLVYTNRVTQEMAGRVQPYVVAFDSAAHPVALNPNWSPLAGHYVDLALTFTRYVRSKPIDGQVTVVQREWVRARTDRALERTLRDSLFKLDEELAGDAIEVEMISANVERLTENGAIVQTRWKERTRFRSGSAGPWRNWVAMSALYYDPTRTRQEDVIPNPTRVYFTHFEPSPEQDPIKEGR